MVSSCPLARLADIDVYIGRRRRLLADWLSSLDDSCIFDGAANASFLARMVDQLVEVGEVLLAPRATAVRPLNSCSRQGQL